MVQRDDDDEDGVNDESMMTVMRMIINYNECNIEGNCISLMIGTELGLLTSTL